MNAYKITDTEGEELYYAANSEAEAIESHNRDWSQEAAKAELILDGELDTLTIVMLDEDESPTDDVMTFREFMRDNEHETQAYQIGDIL